MKNVAKELKNAIKTEPHKTSAYDATAEVVRISGNTAWCHIAGGTEETPVKLTINAKVGDYVQVRVGGGKAWITGNASAPPTDDGTALRAQSMAKNAEVLAADAETSANRAREAADSATASAAEASEKAEQVRVIAVKAEGDADTAKKAAETAKDAADTALVELANVQDVAGVLEWITNHGEMVSQSGGTFNPYEVYFVADPNGVYEVQGSNYSIVSEPKAEDIDDYFVLNVDKSIQNYVSTHIAVNSEGLWLIPEDNATPTSSSRKILIAVGGAGHRYSEAGTYIIGKSNNDDVVLAKFTTGSIQFGDTRGVRFQVADDQIKIRGMSEPLSGQREMMDYFTMDRRGISFYDIRNPSLSPERLYVKDYALTTESSVALLGNETIIKYLTARNATLGDYVYAPGNGLSGYEEELLAGEEAFDDYFAFVNYNYRTSGDDDISTELLLRLPDSYSGSITTEGQMDKMLYDAIDALGWSSDVLV